MPNDREKLLKVMKNLESDYKKGKISAEKYSYFRSKYEDKLNSIDAEAATRKIRSMQGKPSNNTKKKKSNKKKNSKPTRNKRKEEQDLVQKYIINPKKDDKSYNKKKESMNDGTFKLILVLVLAIGFTAGIAYGVLSFDFDSVSSNDAVAVVQDTAFPVVKEVATKNVTNVTSIDYSTQDDSDDEDDEVEEYTETETTTTTYETPSNDQSQSDSSQSSTTVIEDTSSQSQASTPEQSSSQGESTGDEGT